MWIPLAIICLFHTLNYLNGLNSFTNKCIIVPKKPILNSKLKKSIRKEKALLRCSRCQVPTIPQV